MGDGWGKVATVKGELVMEPTLSQTDLRRLEKLAKAAGRTPRAMLRFVLRDGFPETERVVRAVQASRADAVAGRTHSHAEVMASANAAIARHATAKQAA
jgi:predicted transcriptional regulator